MNKKSLAALSVAAVVVASMSLTACGNKTPKALPASSQPAEAAAVVTASIDFGSPLDLGNGVTLTVASPASFTPTIFAQIMQKAK